MKFRSDNFLGFSLVELSIVLVILGLLIGGVLSGQSLIHASALRALTKQHEQTYTAALSFRDKYFGLPGDITNATQFWGAAAAGNACKTTPSTDKKTCDGNGDGQLFGTTISFEPNRFWQQLANAGLIEGNYDGDFITPTSRYSNQPNSIAIGWLGKVTGNVTFYDGDYGNVYTADELAPEDAWNIDKKVDDGMPGTGKFVAVDDNNQFAGNLCSTATSSANLNATYLLTSSQPFCESNWRNEY